MTRQLLLLLVRPFLPLPLPLLLPPLSLPRHQEWVPHLTQNVQGAEEEEEEAVGVEEVVEVGLWMLDHPHYHLQQQQYLCLQLRL